MAVHLTQLRIAGFKSFADPVELAVLPGLTGIVGPNGCGKSNVADALRWAMGEGHARTLSGAEMDDLIFAGTAARPGHGHAAVSLTLAGGGFPAPFAGLFEVQVVRQLRRGAGSAYRVNGREMRGRDVQALELRFIPPVPWSCATRQSGAERGPPFTSAILDVV